MVEKNSINVRSRINSHAYKFLLNLLIFLLLHSGFLFKTHSFVPLTVSDCIKITVPVLVVPRANKSFYKLALVASSAPLTCPLTKPWPGGEGRAPAPQRRWGETPLSLHARLKLIDLAARTCWCHLGSSSAPGTPGSWRGPWQMLFQPFPLCPRGPSEDSQLSQSHCGGSKLVVAPRCPSPSSIPLPVPDALLWAAGAPEVSHSL